MQRYCLILSLLAAGCTFQVNGVAGDDGGAHSIGDLGPGRDLAGQGSSDLAGTPDLGGMDAPPPGTDMLVPFVPSNVDPKYLVPSAPDLMGVTSINTHDLTVNGAPVANGAFVHDSHGYAVLSVGAFTVDDAIAVSGDAPLVVVAAGKVKIDAAITAGANHGTPGPGGSLATLGSGHGGNGIENQTDDSGGGGAGFGIVGAQGADSTTSTGGTAGATYTGFIGGSGGGNGAGNCSGAISDANAGGGAGGGAIQISSAKGIEVTDDGSIDVGGGGGLGGCGSVGAAGGGGGSGGQIFLESLTIQVDGHLTANGGGAGGGGTTNDPGKGDVSGSNGANGTTNVQPAGGGAGAGIYGGNGGDGAAGTTAPTRGIKNHNSGGGGGAVGVIRLRTRSTTATVGSGSVVSPAAIPDTTL